MRGLAADAEGNLWSTESGTGGAHATSAGAVVRISPQGAVTRGDPGPEQLPQLERLGAPVGRGV